MSATRTPYVVDDQPPHLVPVPPIAPPVPTAAVEPVRIGINDRWLFVLRPQAPLSVERLQQAKAELERWWASGEKFCVVGICPGVDVRLQRVDE